VAKLDDEEQLLREAALQNARSILMARQRAEDELLRTREALRLSQERLTAALTAAGTGTFRWDPDRDLLEWDASVSRLLGHDDDGRLAQPLEALLAVVHPDDRDAVGDACRRCAADGARLDIEMRVTWPDGGVHWLDVKARVFADAANGARHMTGACADITRRKSAEAALRDETHTLELLNDAGQTLAATLDLREILQRVTDAATQLSGAQFGAFFYNTVGNDGEAYQLYTLSGAPWSAFEHLGQPRPTALFGPTFRGAAPIRIDDVQEDPRYGRWGPHHGMPPGHLPVCSYLAVAVMSRSGEVIGGLFFGHPERGVFTERAERLVAGLAAQAGIAIDNARLYEAAQRAAEERRLLLDSERAARTAAERASELKDIFLATLSHELRTPLTAILGWAQILRTGSRSEDDMRRGLEAIERNARVQTRLIDDLLDMSRITSGKLRLDIRRVQPIGFIEAALDTLRTAAEARGVRLEPVLDPAAGPIVGDPARLQQVLWNLLSNAIKFTPRGGTVQVTLARVESHVEIEVADTGRGVEPAFLPYLFDRFRQADSAITRTHGGLGLGLSIVKSLVELHGGTVWASSPGEHRGTTVTVMLPLPAVQPMQAQERQHPSAPEPHAVPFVPADLSGVRVLVIDDSPDARELVTRVLEDCRAEVLSCETADEAVRLVAEQRPDVLISDIGMPGVDGYELLRRVRALGAERGGRLPAIALTAFARPEDRTRALRAGFLIHVAKPVDPSDLVATVVGVVGRLDG
jgi:PAS domain S-box-containing protein